VRLGATEGSGNTGSVGTALAGLYGSLTLKEDGTYTYVVNNDNPTVDALGVGASLSESFNYTVSNGTLTDTAVLTVTIKGAEDTVAVVAPPTVTQTPTTTTSTPTTTDAAPTTPTAPIILPLFTPTSTTSTSSSNSNSSSSFSSNSLSSNSSSNPNSSSNSNSPSTTTSPSADTPTLTTTTPTVTTTSSRSTTSDNSSSSNSIVIPASQSTLISVGPSSASSTGSGTGTGTGTGFSSDGGAISTGLSVRTEVAPQQVGGTSGDSFKIPAGVFGHTDPKAVVTIQATLEDGSPLPSWLKFDPGSGTFSGKPPEGEKQELQIKVTARDDAGSEATVNFKLDVNENGNQPAGERQDGQTNDGQNNGGQKRTDAGRPADRQAAQAAPLGRPSLTAQLKAASGQNGFMAEGLALLESLLKAAGIEDTDKAA
jgi:VCBS repeat-containing protein